MVIIQEIRSRSPSPQPNPTSYSTYGELNGRTFSPVRRPTKCSASFNPSSPPPSICHTEQIPKKNIISLAERGRDIAFVITSAISLSVFIGLGVLCGWPITIGIILSQVSISLMIGAGFQKLGLLHYVDMTLTQEHLQNLERLQEKEMLSPTTTGLILGIVGLYFLGPVILMGTSIALGLVLGKAFLATLIQRTYVFIFK